MWQKGTLGKFNNYTDSMIYVFCGNIFFGEVSPSVEIIVVGPEPSAL